MRLESDSRTPVSPKGRCSLRNPYLIPWFLLLLCAPLLGQSGTFTGVVSDSTEAVLPGVELTITNLNTGQERTATTGDKGLYRATNLPRGRYDLAAALAGFKTHARSDVELTVGEIKRVDFRLEPGEITARVTVTGKTPVVNTEEGRISTLVTEAQISSLPLNGRNVFALAVTQPGVVALDGVGMQSVSSSFSAQGNRHRATNFMLDGTDLNRPGIGGEPALIPVQDAVEEFRLSKLRDQKAWTLSGGEKRRLEVARAMIQNPKIILLDEPFVGIDPITVSELKTTIQDLRKRGIGFLITDHNVRETLPIIDRAYLIYDGQILLDADSETLLKDPKAREIYLGQDFEI